MATSLTAAISSGTNVSYTWDLGDGTSGSGPQLSHIYPNIGLYTATVTATNTANIQTATTLVTVEPSEFIIYSPAIAKP
jgi:PKD repeat protein